MDHHARRQLAIEELQNDWLRDVTWLAEVDSTNSLARRRLAEGDLTLPALLIADAQTAGRGRTTRSWWSPGGCLMMSLVVDDSWLPMDAERWPQLSLVAGVAAAKAAEQYVPSISVKLKWPNDLYVGDSKLAGILVEAVPRGPTKTRCAFIIGIGLNVAVDFALAPREIQQRACSLSQFSRQPLDCEGMLIHLIEHLQRELADWQAGELQWWHQWSQRSLLTGRCIQAQQSPGQTITGACEGIDQQGYLMLRTAGGVYHLQSADILHWE